MKKRAITCLLCLSLFLNMAITTYASSVSEKETGDVAGSEKDLEQNENTEELDKFIQSLAEENKQEAAKDYLETKRLIVKSPQNIKNKVATTKISKLGNTYILAYETADAAQEDYINLLDDTEIEYVEKDQVCYIEGEITDIKKQQSKKDKEDKEKTEVSDIKKIAVIDTGLTGETEESADITGEGMADNNGHGTAVVNEIKDVAKNNVKIIPIKALNDDGYGNISDI